MASLLMDTRRDQDHVHLQNYASCLLEAAYFLYPPNAAATAMSSFSFERLNIYEFNQPHRVLTSVGLPQWISIQMNAPT